MTFKSALYSSYRSTHNRYLYGEIGLAHMRKEFKALDGYYRQLLPHSPDARILDLGCGDGGFVYYLQERGYRNTIGIDLSEEQVATGRQLGIPNLIVSDAISFLTQNQGMYDLIIARDLMEHCTKQEAFDLLNTISANLGPEGYFAMQVPNGEGIHAASIIYGDYTHETPYTASSGRQLLLNTGFSEVATYPVNPLLIGKFGWLRVPLWSLRLATHRFWRMIETGNGKGVFTSNIIIVGKK